MKNTALKFSLRQALSYALGIFGIIIAYGASGRLGLLLAIPPGYATAIWPPSGIVLAALLLLGQRFWPGVWLGSFLLNASLHISNLSDPNLVFATTNAAFIACAATMQALSAVWLIKKTIRLPSSLERVRDITAVTFLGGPVSCLIGATISIAVLTARGSIPASEALFSWFTWWVGDTIGVLIFTPLIILLAQNKNSVSQQRKWAVTLPSVIMFALTIYIFVTVSHWEHEKTELAFEKQAESTLTDLHENLNNYLGVLYAIERFYNSSDFIDRGEFSNFVQYGFERFSGIEALAWVPRVEANQRSSYENAARADGYTNFQFKEVNPAGGWSVAPNREEYFPILYIEPKMLKESVLGFDMASEAVRADAIMRARDTGETIASGRIKLLQRDGNEHDNPFGILLYKPIYAGKPTNLVERQHQLKGFAVGIFAIDEIVEPMQNILSPDGLIMSLYDITDKHKIELLYSSDPKTTIQAFDSTQQFITWQRDFQIAGREWRLSLAQTENYLLAHKSWESWFALAGGLLITAMLGILLLLVTGRADMIGKLVDDKTKELAASELRSSLLKNIAIEAMQADTIGQIIHISLTKIGNYLGWPIGHAYLWNAASNILWPSCIWHFETKETRHEEFMGVTEQTTFEPGEGLPGLVLAERKMVYIANIAEEPSFSRKNMMIDTGLKTAIGIPVFVKDNVKLVLEFFTADLVVEEKNLAEFFEMIGLQIGRVIENKTAQQALEESSRLNNAILSSAGYIIVATDREGKIIVFNPEGERALGYTAEEVMGKTPAIWHDPLEVKQRAIELSNELKKEVIPGFEVFTAKQLLDGAEVREWNFIRKDGTSFPGQLVATPLKDNAGQIVGFLGIIQDITERKQIDQMKSEFISTVSHELRTPLTSIRGALGLIASGAAGELPADAKELTDIAYNNSVRLVRIINDILDIEKIESGKMQMQIKPVEVHAILTQAVKANEAYAEKYEVKFKIEDTPQNVEVLADPDRLMQVLANLLSNAAKFSPADSTVFVWAKLNGRSMRFYVQDHGTGIPEEFRSRIFGKFAQADHSTTRRYDGTGLGLSITQKFIEAMQGKIAFESEVDKGTTFYFDLPLVKTAVAPNIEADNTNNRPRILHVEDDRDLGKVIKEALRQHANVIIATSLEEAHACLDHQKFDLVILDPHLPDGNSLTLLNKIQIAETKMPPILVLSASDIDADIQDTVNMTLVKSRVSETVIVEKVMALLADYQTERT